MYLLRWSADIAINDHITREITRKYKTKEVHHTLREGPSW